jgi:hypothetical protein
MPSGAPFFCASNTLTPYEGGYQTVGISAVGGTSVPVLIFLDSLGRVSGQQSYLLDTSSTPNLTFDPEYDQSLNYLGANIYNACSSLWFNDSTQLGQCPCHIWLTKTDSEGRRIWSYSYGVSTENIVFPAVNFLGSDSILLAYVQYGGSWNQLSQIKIILLDTAGNYVRDFYDSQPTDMLLFESQGKLIKTRDNGYVFGASKGYWQDTTYPYDVLYKGIAVKLDSTGQEQWRYINPGDSTDGTYSDISSVIEAHDGSIIAAGDILLSDTADPPYQFMTMAKLTAEGQPIWNRRYTYFSTASNYLAQQNFSVKECPDGGYILCGISDSGTDQNDIDERGWLVKTDSFGCLIPSCQLWTGIEAVATDSLDLKLYPNPATDFINFIIHSTSHHTFALTITNITGQMVFKTSVSTDVTNMISTSSFTDGEYILSFTDNAGNNLQKKVVITK